MPLPDPVRVLLAPSPRPYHVEEPAIRHRRRAAVAITLAIGTVLLALALGTDSGDDRFYPLTIALAASWLIGAGLSGPLHLGYWGGGPAPDGELSYTRDLIRPTLLGVGAFGVFVAGDLIFKQVPFFDRQITAIIGRADTGSLALVIAVAVVNGIGEEFLFRGALYSAFGPNRPALWSTVLYVVVTAFTLNLSLVVAGAVMGTLFALERRATRGILAPIVTHVVWSVLMIIGLPR